MSLGKAQVFQPFPTVPDLLFARIAARSDAFRGNPNSTSVLVGAAAGDRAEDVRRRARGELIERVSNVLAGRAAESAAGLRGPNAVAGLRGPNAVAGLRDPNAVAPQVGTYRDLRRQGVPALDPAGWSENEGRSELRDAPLLWVSGRSMTTDREVLVPAGAAFLRHRPPAGCTGFPEAGSTGVAAHPSPTGAVEHAILEVLERDLIWRSWYTAERPPVVDRQPLASPVLEKALRALDLDATTLVLPGPDHTACVVVALSDGDRRQQSFGARCAPGDADAWSAAAYEALMVRWSMQTPEAERAWQAMGARRPRDALEHALVTFHRQDSLGHWLDRARANGVRATPLGPPRPLAHVLADHTGGDVVAIDTTRPEFAREGLTVVRVVAPGARRLPADESRSDLGLPHPIG